LSNIKLHDRGEKTIYNIVNPGTFFIVFILIFQAISSRDLKQFSLLLFLDAMAFTLLANSGYFIKIGSLMLEYEEILTIMFLFSYFITFGSNQIDKKTFLKGIILIVVAIIGVFNLLLTVHPNTLVVPIGSSWDAYYAGKNVMIPLSFSSANLERIFRLILFVLIGLSIKDILQSERNLVAKLLIYITSIQILIGFIDLISKLIFNLPVIPTFSKLFFGVGSSQYSGFTIRAGLPIIQGFMKEPSHYANSFIPGLTYLALIKNKTQKLIIIESLSILILLLSGSFAGFAIILYWFLLHSYNFIMNSRLGKFPSFLVVIVIFTLVAGFVQILSYNLPIVEYYLSRFYALLGTAPSVGSEQIRLMSITYSYKLFFKYPLFGIGIGSSIAHGFMPNLLANMGIIGFFSWLIFSFDAFMIKYNTLRNLPVLIIFMFMMNFLGDIGWTYSMMGVSMLIGLYVGIWNLDTVKKTKVDKQEEIA